MLKITDLSVAYNFNSDERVCFTTLLVLSNLGEGFGSYAFMSSKVGRLLRLNALKRVERFMK